MISTDSLLGTSRRLVKFIFQADVIRKGKVTFLKMNMLHLVFIFCLC